MTKKGRLRTTELVRLRDRSVLEKDHDAVRKGWKFIRPSVGRIVEEVIKALVLIGIGILIGVRPP